MQRDLSNQDISLKSRKNLEVTGVKKIKSLNEDEFLVQTTLGLLQVQGENLEMSQLDLEKGILELSGKVNKVEYLQDNLKEKKKLFRNIFK